MNADTPDSDPQSDGPNAPKLVTGLLLSLVYFAMVAANLADGSQKPFVAVLGLVWGGAVLIMLLLVGFIAHRENRDALRPQFSIGWLLTVITAAALYLAGVRWLLSGSGWADDPTTALMSVAAVLILSMYMLFLSVIPLALFSEGLMWTAVWIVRRRCFQRLLRRR